MEPNRRTASIHREVWTVQDSHDQRLARVRRTIQAENRDRASRRAVEDAQGLIRSLAASIGFVERGGDIPRCCNDTVVGIERPTHTGGSNRECAVLQWLTVSADAVSVSITGVSVPGSEAAFLGWEALCAAIRSWRIYSREGLSEWVHRQGFPQSRWSGHVSGRERILSGPSIWTGELRFSRRYSAKSHWKRVDVVCHPKKPCTRQERRRDVGTLKRSVCGSSWMEWNWMQCSTPDSE